MFILIIGLVVFLGVHLYPAIFAAQHQARIQNGKEKTARGAIALGAMLGLGLIIWGYGLAREETIFLYQLPFWVAHLTSLLTVISFILMAQISFPGKLAKAVKHPMLLAVKLWAFSHLLANGDLASILLFGSFLAWAVIARITLKRRVAAGLAKANAGGPLRNDIISIVLGLVISVVIIRWLHELLIGVAPIAH